MRKRKSSLIEDFINLPWWLNVIVVIAGNIFIRKIIPLWIDNQKTNGPIGVMLSGGVEHAMPIIANWFSMVFGLVLILSIIKKMVER